MPTNYKVEEFIVKKIPYKNINSTDKTWLNACHEIDDQRNFPANVSRCYSVKTFGEEDRSYQDRICREYYSDQKLYKIDCNKKIGSTLTFLPNGLFVHTYLFLSLDSNPEDGKKDSMMLSHGLCGTIN